MGILFYFQVSNWNEKRKTKLEEVKIALVKYEFSEAETEVVVLMEELKQTINDADVANVTFHSDFHLKFGKEAALVKDQITLLLVKTENDWKCIHEHHSPLKNVSH
jgi:ketosteroid isomerase-like protein